MNPVSSAVTELKVRVAQLGEKRASITTASLQLELADRELGGRIARLEAGITESIERAAELRRGSEQLGRELFEQRGCHREQAEALNAELEAEVARLESEFDPASVQLESVPVKPRKADIAVEDLALVWRA